MNAKLPICLQSLALTCLAGVWVCLSVWTHTQGEGNHSYKIYRESQSVRYLHFPLIVAYLGLRFSLAFYPNQRRKGVFPFLCYLNGVAILLLAIVIVLLYFLFPLQAIRD